MEPLQDYYDLEEVPVYVTAVYAVDRVYGGPEEGGWYYTYGDLVGTIGATADEDDAYGIAWRFNRLLADGGPRRDGLEARVYQLGRLEYPADACHVDYAPEEREPRYDVPLHFPEGRAHYC